MRARQRSVWLRRSRSAAGGSCPLELGSCVADIPLTPRRILLQAAFEKARQIRWCRPRKGGPVGLMGQDCRDRVRECRARESGTAGQEFIEHAAKRPDVRPLVDHLPASLLRAHVGGRPENHAVTRVADAHCGRPRQRWAGSIGGAHFRQPEVEDFHSTRGRNLDIRGLQIAMDDSSFVRGVERIGDLPRDRERLWNRQALDSCLTSGELVREGVPFDQLQHQRRNAVRLLDAVDRTDMRMIEGREQAGFTLEPGETVGIRRKRRRQNLDRDVPSQLRVAARDTPPPCRLRQSAPRSRTARASDRSRSPRAYC